ncbi:MAG: DedA family protein [Cyanobium sp.]
MASARPTASDDAWLVIAGPPPQTAGSSVSKLLSLPMVSDPLALFSLEGGLNQAILQELLRQWGYGVIFLAMLLENAGLPLPGETVTLLGGYAAGSGQLNVFGVMAAAAGGAMLGDNLGYWVGRRAGWGLILRVGRLLRQSPEQLDQLREQFLRHANASVLLGRFVAVLRVVAGPMAGAVGMPYPRFLLCNTAGALLWAGTMVSLAWLGGRWIPFSQMVGGVIDFGLGALLLVALVVVVPKLLSRLERRQLMRPEGSANPANPSDNQPTGPIPPTL